MQERLSALSLWRGLKPEAPDYSNLNARLMIVVSLKWNGTAWRHPALVRLFAKRKTRGSVIVRQTTFLCFLVLVTFVVLSFVTTPETPRRG